MKDEDQTRQQQHNTTTTHRESACLVHTNVEEHNPGLLDWGGHGFNKGDLLVVWITWSGTSSEAGVEEQPGGRPVGIGVGGGFSERAGRRWGRGAHEDGADRRQDGTIGQNSIPGLNRTLVMPCDCRGLLCVVAMEVVVASWIRR